MPAIELQSKTNISVRVFETPTAHGHKSFKILLTKFDHIGDFITAIDAFRLIRQAFAGAEITLMCLPSVVALASSTGLFDRVAGFAAEPASHEIGFVAEVSRDEQISTFKSLLDGPYFLAADFKHDLSSRIWLDHVEAEVRAGFMANTLKGLDIVLPLMEWEVPFSQIRNRNLPVHAEVRLTLLAHAICDSLLEKPLDADLFALKGDLDTHPVYRRLADDHRMKIGVSLGAGSEVRQWDFDYWSTLLHRLIATHHPLIVFFGGPSDKKVTFELIERLGTSNCNNLVGETDLPEVPAYLNLLDSYIGCDTGLTHLAANLGLPTVNIYAGISNISVWRARGPKVKTVYADVRCAPCHLRFKADCPNNHVCLKVVVPDIVFACFEQVIALG